MVDTTVGAAAADWVCIDTPTPLSAKSTNKTGIQKGIFLILHCLLSFRNGGCVHLIIGVIWLGLAWLGLAWLARIMPFAFSSKFTRNIQGFLYIATVRITAKTQRAQRYYFW